VVWFRCEVTLRFLLCNDGEIPFFFHVLLRLETGFLSREATILSEEAKRSGLEDFHYYRLGDSLMSAKAKTSRLKTQLRSPTHKLFYGAESVLFIPKARTSVFHNVCTRYCSVFELYHYHLPHIHTHQPTFVLSIMRIAVFQIKSLAC